MALGPQLMSGVPSDVYDLRVGVNTFHVCSLRDGNYTFVVTRAPPDINYVSQVGFLFTPHHLWGPSPAVVLAPSILSSIYYYTETIPYVTLGVYVTVWFSTPGSVLVSQNNTQFEYVVNGNRSSTLYMLPIGSHMFLLNSSLDGQYVVNITRLPPDLTTLALRGLSTTDQMWDMSAMMLEQKAVAFVPGVTVGYNVTVPYIASRVDFYSVFGVAGSISTYVLEPPNPVSRAASATLGVFSDQWSTPQQLSVGWNTLILDSTRDGIYTVHVYRMPPDINTLTIRGNSDTGLITNFTLDGPLPPQSPLGLVPVFTPGLFPSALTVSFIVHRLYFRATYKTANTLSMHTGDPYNQIPVLNGVETAAMTLAEDATAVATFVHSLDGNYTISVYRQKPVLTGVTLQVQIDHDVTVNILTTPLIFVPGVYEMSTQKLPYGCERLMLYLGVGSGAGALFVRINALGPVAITGSSGPHQLDVGVNAFRVFSVLDGTYTFSIERDVPDVQSITLNGFSTSDQIYPVTKQVVPNYTPGLYALPAGFLLTVPYIVQFMTVRTVFRIGPLTWSLNTAANLGSAILSPMENRTDSVRFYLPVQTNLLQVRSAEDGIYSTKVTRSPPDVRELRLLGRTDEGVIEDFSVQMTPNYVPGEFPAHFTRVDYAVLWVALVPVYSVNGTVFINTTLSRNAPVASNTTSAWFRLGLDITTLHLWSTQDGNYTFYVQRAPPDIQSLNVTLQANPSNLALIGLSAGEIRTPWQFDSANNHYSVRLPFKFDRMNLRVHFLLGTVTVSFNNTMVYAMTSMTPVTFWQLVTTPYLPPGLTVVRIRSSKDGVYVFNVNRDYPALTGVTLRSRQVDNTPLDLTLNTPFLPGQYFYSITGGLDYINYFISVLCYYHTSDSIMLTNTLRGAGQPPLGPGVPTPSAAWSLDVASQVIWVNSTLDGFYTFTVLRLPPDIQTLVINGWSKVNGQINAMNHLPNRMPTPLYVPGATLFGLPVPYYQVDVPNAISDISFSSLLTKTMDISCTRAGVTACTPHMLTGGITVAAVRTSVEFPILSGSTTDFKLVSVGDGNYLVKVVRSPLSVTNVELLAVRNTGEELPVPFHQFLCPATSTLTTAFCPGFYSYNATVTFAMSRITMRVTFSLGTIALTMNGAATTPVGSSAGSPGRSAPMPLSITEAPATAVNVLRMTSTSDGIFEFIVARNNPDVQRAWMVVEGRNPFAGQTAPVNSSITIPTVTTPAPTFAFPLLPAFGTLIPGTFDRNPAIDSLVYTTSVSTYSAVLYWAVFFKTPSQNVVKLDNARQAGGGVATATSSSTNVIYYRFGLVKGLNFLYLNSTLDGSYRFEVTRALGDIYTQKITGQSDKGVPYVVSANTLDGDSIDLRSTCYPPEVPYWVTSVQYIVSFSTLNSVRFLSNTFGASWISLQSGQATASYPLAIGVNSFLINSTIDYLSTGTTNCTIVRKPPNVQTITMRATLNRRTTTVPIGLPVTEELQSQLLPTVFVSGFMDYRLTKNYIYRTVQLNANWQVDETITVQCNCSTAAPQAITRMQYSAQFPLQPGLNIIQISSTIDGNYTIMLTIRDPVLTRAALLPTTCGPGADLGVRLAFPSLPALVYTPLPFARGLLSYAATVPFAQQFLIPNLAFVPTTSVQTWKQVTEQGERTPVPSGLLAVSQEFSATASSLPNFENTRCDSVVVLDPGLNTLSLFSNEDGIYLFNITRLPARFELLGKREQMYSLQPSGDMFLNPLRENSYTGFPLETVAVTVRITITGVKTSAYLAQSGLPADIVVDIASSAQPPNVNSFQQVSSELAPVLNNRWTFRFTIPEYKPLLVAGVPDSGQRVKVQFFITGDTARFDPLPAYDIAIWRQSILDYDASTKPALPLYMFATLTQRFGLRPDEEPRIIDGPGSDYMNLTVSASVAGAWLAPPILWFKRQEDEQPISRIFTLTAPDVAAVFTSFAPSWYPLTLSYSASGPDAAHYILPAPLSIAIIPRSQFVFNWGPTPTNLTYSGQLINNLQVRPAYGTFSRVTLMVSWSFDAYNVAAFGMPQGVVRAMSAVGSPGSNATFEWTTVATGPTAGFQSTMNYNPTVVCVSSCPLVPTSELFEIRLPSLPFDDNMTLHFTVGGPDADHYIAPPPLRMYVVKQAYIQTEGVPLTVFAGQTVPFSVNLTVNPVRIIPLTSLPVTFVKFIVTGAITGEQTPELASIQFTTADTQAFSFPASPQAQVLTLSAVALGPNSWQYLFKPLLITVLARMTPPDLPFFMWTNQAFSTGPVALTGYPSQSTVAVQLSYLTSSNDTTYVRVTEPAPVDFFTRATNNTAQGLMQPFSFFAPPAVPTAATGSVPCPVRAGSVPTSVVSGSECLSVSYLVSGSLNATVGPISPLSQTVSILPQASMTLTGWPTYLYQNQRTPTMSLQLSAMPLPCISATVNGQLARSVCKAQSPPVGAPSSLYCCLDTCPTMGTPTLVPSVCLRTKLQPWRHTPTGDSVLPADAGFFTFDNPSGDDVAGPFPGGVWQTFSYAPPELSAPSQLRTFRYTAPAGVGMVTVPMEFVGDIAHYRVQHADGVRASPVAEPLQVEIRQQGLFTIVGEPAKMLVSTTRVITVAIDQQPELGGSMTLTISLLTALGGVTVAERGSVTPSVLEFNSSNWNLTQSFTILSPMYAQDSQLTYEVVGRNALGVLHDNNKFQYLPPTNRLVVIKGTIYISNAPTYLYTDMKWTNVKLTAAGKVAPDLHVTVRWLTYMGIGAPVDEVLSLASSTASFTIKAPPAVNSGQQVSIEFIKSGADAYLYDDDHPAEIFVSLIPQSTLSLSFIPSNVLVGKTATLRMTLSDRPINPTDPRAIAMGISESSVKFVPTLLTPLCTTDDCPQWELLAFATNPPNTFTFDIFSSTLARDFIFAAPTQAMTVELFFLDITPDPGVNSFQYKLPPHYKIVINPVGSWYINMPQTIFASNSSNQQTCINVTVLPSSLPVQGIILIIELQAPALLSDATISSADDVPKDDQADTVEFRFDGGESIRPRYMSVCASVLPGALTFVFDVKATEKGDTTSPTQLPRPEPIVLTVVGAGLWKLTELPRSLPASTLLQTSYLEFDAYPVAPLLGGSSVSLFVRVYPETSNSTVLFLASLTWFDNSPQRFLVQMPTLSQKVTVKFNSSNNAAYPAPGEAYVYVLGLIDVQGRPSSLYTNETSGPMDITPMLTIEPTRALSVTALLTPKGLGVMSPDSLAFSSSATQTFVILAPNVTTTLSLSFVLSDVSAPRFAPIASSLIVIKPQGRFIVELLGGTRLNAFDKTSFTVTITEAPNAGTQLILCMGVLAPAPQTPLTQGSLTSPSFGGLTASICGGSPYLVFDEWSTNPLPTYTVTYEAPLDVFDLSITFLSSGTDAAHFQNPTPILLKALGPMRIAGCSQVNSVLVSGAPDYAINSFLFNGLYYVAAPINNAPHYVLRDGDGGGQTGMTALHLFFAPNYLSPFPTTLWQGRSGTWILDADPANYALPSSVDLTGTIYDPLTNTTTSILDDPTFGVQYDAALHGGAIYSTLANPISPVGAWYSVMLGSLVPTLSAACGVDCTLLGDVWSLETTVCFNGNKYAETDRLTGQCSLSCAHYIKGVRAACAPTTDNPPGLSNSYSVGQWLGVQQAVLSAINNPTCIACSYSNTIDVLRTCGGSMTHSDASLDLLYVLSLPDECTPACAARWPGFYSTCVANSLMIPSNVAAFHSLCSAPPTPLPVSALVASAITDSGITISWQAPLNVPRNAEGLTYWLEWCVGAACTSWTRIAGQGALLPALSSPSFRFATSATVTVQPSTPYRFQVYAVTAAGVRSAASPPLVATTFASAPSNKLDCGGEAVMDAHVMTAGLPGLPRQWSVRIHWAGSLGMQYRILVYRGPPGSVKVERTEVVYTGTALETTITVPGAPWANNYLVAFVQCARTVVSAGTTQMASDYSTPKAESTEVLETQRKRLLPTLPMTPPWLPSQSGDLTPTSVTLRWQPYSVHSMCGGEDCQTLEFVLYRWNGSLVGSGLRVDKAAVATVVTIPSATEAGWLTPLQPETDYTFVLQAEFQSGQTISAGYPAYRPGLPITLRTTGPLPVLLTPPSYTPLSYASASVTWNLTLGEFYSSSSPVDLFHFNLVPTSYPSPTLAGRSVPPTLDLFVPLADLLSQNGAPVTTVLRSLHPATTYTVSWRVRNSYGWSRLPDVLNQTLSMADSPPRLLSLVAGYTTADEFAAGSSILLTFDKAVEQQTNFKDVVCSWSSSINDAATWVTAWLSRSTQLRLQVTAVKDAQLAPVVGQFSVLLNASYFSESFSPALANSAKFDGLWEPAQWRFAYLQGSFGEARSKFLKASTLDLTVDENSLDNLLPLAQMLRTTNITEWILAGNATLTVQAISGFVAYPKSHFVANPYTRALRLRRVSLPVVYMPLVLGVNADRSDSVLVEFAYSPPTNFVGMDTLALTLRLSSGVSETAYVTIRTMRINLPPAIAVPLTPTPLAVGQSILLTSALLNITDVDAKAGAEVSVTLYEASSSTCQLRLHAPIPADVSSSLTALNVSAPTLTLTGPLGSVLRVLATVSFSDSGVNAEWPVPFTLNVHVSDLGSALVERLPAQAADANIVFQPTCGSLPAPVLLRAQFAPDLQSVVLDFDRVVSLFAPAQPLFVPGFPLPTPWPAPARNFYDNVAAPPVSFNWTLCDRNGTYDVTHAQSIVPDTPTFVQLCSTLRAANQTYVPPPAPILYDLITLPNMTRPWPALSFTPTPRPTYTCANFTTTAFSAKLGANYACSFVNATRMRITLGTAHTLLPGVTVEMPEPNPIRSCVTSAAWATGSVTLQLPTALVVPVASIVGPSQLSSCEDLVLSSVVSAVAGPVSYQWNCSVPSLLYPYRTNLPTLSIPSGALLNVDPLSYSFGLLVTSSQGATSLIDTITLKKLVTPTPTVSVVGGDDRQVTRAQPLTMAVTASATKCASARPAHQLELRFQWTASIVTHNSQTVPPTITVSNAWSIPSSIVSTTRSLTIPPNTLNTLDAGMRYLFKCAVSLVGDQDAGDFSKHTDAQVLVEVSPAPISVSISGGDLQTVPSQFPVRITADISDPDKVGSTATPTEYTYAWRCERVPLSGELSSMAAPLPCYNALTQNVVSFPSFSSLPAAQSAAMVSAGTAGAGVGVAPIGSSGLLVAANSTLPESLGWVATSASSNGMNAVELQLRTGILQPASYVFTLFVTQAAADATTVTLKNSTSSVRMVVTASLAAPQLQLFPSSTLVNPSDVLSIQSSCESAPDVLCSTTLPAGVAYMWSMGAGSNFAPFSDPSITTGWNGPSLWINTDPSAAKLESPIRPAVFPAGATLTFRLTVTLATGESAFAEVVIQVTKPPQGGTFTVTPATAGIGLQTVYNVAASGWVRGDNSVPDSRGAVLQYDFFSVQADGSVLPFGSSLGLPTASDMLFPSTSTNNQVQLWLRVTDSSGAFTYQQVSVEVMPQKAVGAAPALTTQTAQVQQTDQLRSQIATMTQTASTDSIAVFITGQLQSDQRTLVQAVKALTPSTPLPAPAPLSPLGALNATFWTPLSRAFNNSWAADPTYAMKDSALRCLASFTPVTQVTLAASPYSTVLSAAALRLLTLANSLIQLTQVSAPSRSLLRACTAIANEASFTPVLYLLGHTNLDGFIATCSAIIKPVAQAHPAACVTGVAQDEACAAEKEAILQETYAATVSLWQLHSLSTRMLWSTVTDVSTLLVSQVASSSRLVWSAEVAPASWTLVTPPSVQPTALMFSSLATKVLPLPGPAAQINTLLSSFNAVLDSYVRGVLFSAGEQVWLDDCDFPSFVRLDWSGSAMSQAFKDGSRVSYAADFVSRTTAQTRSNRVATSASLGLRTLVATRAIYARVNPFVQRGVDISTQTVGGWRLLSGVMITSRSTADAVAITSTLAAPALSVTIRYDGSLCNPVCGACQNGYCKACNAVANITCAPQCLMLDQASNSWKNDTGLVTTIQFTAVAGNPQWMATCTLNRLASATLAVFTGPRWDFPEPIVYVPPPIVVPSSSSSSAGPAPSSTGPGDVVIEEVYPRNVSVACGVMRFPVEFLSLAALPRGVEGWKHDLIMQLSTASGVHPSLFSVQAPQACGARSTCVQVCVMPFLTPQSVPIDNSTAAQIDPALIGVVHPASINFLSWVNASLSNHSSAWWDYPILNTIEDPVSPFAPYTWLQCAEATEIKSTCQPAPPALPPPEKKSPFNWMPIIIGGGAGLVLVGLCLLFVLWKRRKDRHDAMKKDEDDRFAELMAAGDVTSTAAAALMNPEAAERIAAAAQHRSPLHALFKDGLGMAGSRAALPGTGTSGVGGEKLSRAALGLDMGLDIDDAKKGLGQVGASLAKKHREMTKRSLLGGGKGVSAKYAGLGLVGGTMGASSGGSGSGSRSGSSSATPPHLKYVNTGASSSALSPLRSPSGAASGLSSPVAIGVGAFSTAEAAKVDDQSYAGLFRTGGSEGASPGAEGDSVPAAALDAKAFAGASAGAGAHYVITSPTAASSGYDSSLISPGASSSSPNASASPAASTTAARPYGLSAMQAAAKASQPLHAKKTSKPKLHGAKPKTPGAAGSGNASGAASGAASPRLTAMTAPGSVTAGAVLPPSGSASPVVPPSLAAAAPALARAPTAAAASAVAAGAAAPSLARSPTLKPARLAKSPSLGPAATPSVAAGSPRGPSARSGASSPVGPRALPAGHFQSAASGSSSPTGMSAAASHALSSRSGAAPPRAASPGRAAGGVPGGMGYGSFISGPSGASSRAVSPPRSGAASPTSPGRWAQMGAGGVPVVPRAGAAGGSAAAAAASPAKLTSAQKAAKLRRQQNLM